MRARTAIAWMAHRVRHSAAGAGLLAIFTCVAVSACTSGGTTSSTSVFSPSASVSVSVSASVSISPNDVTTTVTTTPGTSASASPSPSPSPSPSTSFPTAAPVTGGGGTAGFQDAGLAIVAGAAILAGAAGVVYRRRMSRNR